MKFLWLIVGSFLIVNGQQTNNNDYINITPPRLDDKTVIIDGHLDEPVWTSASSRSGFRSYLPVDGRPAEDDTEIRIWYSPTALYVGIIAHEAHCEVRSTLADRDNLDNEDFILIVLDTYNDKRSAFTVAVNPIGQQADGTLTDITSTSRRSVLPFSIDDNPD